MATPELPHNLDAEKSILGAMMLTEDAVDEAIDGLRAEDFFVYRNRTIFEHMKELVAKGKPVDFVTLTDALEATNKMDSVGGYNYINEISTFTPAAANIGHYIEIVRNASKCRKLYEVARKIGLAARNGSDPEQIMVDALQSLDEIAQSDTGKDELIDANEMMRRFGAWLDSIHDTRIKTGWKTIDLLAPLEPGNVVVIAGRPGMGKSALAEVLGLSIANMGHKVIFVSLEMPEKQLNARAVSHYAGVPLLAINAKKVAGVEAEQVDEAMGFISDMGQRFNLVDNPSATPQQIRRICKRHRPECVIVDYMQLINPGKECKAENREQTVANIMRYMRQTGRELGIVVILLSQLNRAVEDRENRRPMLSHLRESGSIEQDADMVWMIHREGYYDKDTNKFTGTSDDAELIVRKNRNGPLLTIPMRWIPETTTYMEKEKAT